MRSKQANVVLVVLDTVRGLTTVPADRALLPSVARLAATGVEYRRAFASAPWTLPSHAAMLTGTYSSKHDTHGSNPGLGASLSTLPEALSAAGYETRAISNNTWISDEFGFDRGFDRFEHAWRRGSGEEDAPSEAERGDGDEWRTRATADLRADETTDRALDWLSGLEGRPFFLFLNYIDAHFAYTPPEEYVVNRLPGGYDYDQAVDVLQDPRAFDAGEEPLTAEECSVLRALYRGELAYLDANIGRIVDGLKARGAWEDTVLIVTSDHGENVGEHGFVGHQYNLYDSLLHVPLVIAGGSFDDGRGSDRLVQLPDLPATILDEVGIDSPEIRAQFQGRSFHPDVATPPRDHVVAEHVCPRPTIGTLERRYGDLPPALASLERSLPLRAVRTERWKLVTGSDGSRSLYDLDADPMEETDVVDRRAETADRLGGVLTEWLASFEPRLTESSTDISAESQERLRNLGYL